jgi:hypothetical protein
MAIPSITSITPSTDRPEAVLGKILVPASNYRSTAASGPAVRPAVAVVGEWRGLLPVIGVFLVNAVLVWLRHYSVSWLGERVVADLRGLVFDPDA